MPHHSEDDDDETEYLEYDHEAAEKAGFGGVPVEDMDQKDIAIVMKVSKGE